jgi:hypothetical protein
MASAQLDLKLKTRKLCLVIGTAILDELASLEDPLLRRYRLLRASMTHQEVKTVEDLLASIWQTWRC